MTMSDEAGGIAEEFLSEAAEIVEQLGGHLLRLEEQAKKGSLDPDIMNAAFRAAHSLKGIAGMFGADRVGALAHRLEDLLDGLRMGRVKPGPSVLDVLFEGVEALDALVAEVGKHTDAGDVETIAPRVASLMDKVTAILEERPPEKHDPLDDFDISSEVLEVLTEYEEQRLRENARTGANLYRVRVEFELSTFDEGLMALSGGLKKVGEVISTLPSGLPANETAIVFDILVGSPKDRSTVEAACEGFDVEIMPIERTKQPEVGASSSPAPMPEPMTGDDVSPSASGKKRPPTQVGAYSARVDEKSPAVEEADAALEAATGSEEYASLAAVARTVRVDISRLDELMNIVGELVLSKANLQRISDSLKSELGFRGVSVDLYKEARSLERRIDLLQKGVIEVRMVPLGQIFDKLSRMLRKMAREAGKDISFEVSGGETELDKLITEELSDPLMHIIRNSIDHGIEAAEVRSARGKPARGTIRLDAYQKGNHVTIEVSDDGAGLDEHAILRHGLERGLVGADQVKELSRRDILGLIFAPGFSTRQEVSGLSGRGVGMDVVKTNIGQLSGVIDVDSEFGVGSTFAMTLPITLAIIQGLIIRAAGQVFTVPLNSVIEILRIRQTEVRTVERQEVIDLRGSTVPLVRLGRLFGLQGSASEDEHICVVIVGLAQNRLGVAVDQLLGQQDVVIKSLGRRLGNVRGIAGATDLGDNRTTLVVDVAALIEEVLERDLQVAAN